MNSKLLLTNIILTVINVVHFFLYVPDSERGASASDARAEQRLQSGGVRGRGSGQVLVGAALCAGDLPGELHPHHRRYVQTSHIM